MKYYLKDNIIYCINNNKKTIQTIKGKIKINECIELKIISELEVSFLMDYNYKAILFNNNHKGLEYEHYLLYFNPLLIQKDKDKEILVNDYISKFLSFIRQDKYISNKIIRNKSLIEIIKIKYFS